MNIDAYNLDSLRTLVHKLERENKNLKQKLNEANIPYNSENIFAESSEENAEYDQDQGGRIMERYITEKMTKVLDESLIYEILSVVEEIPEGCVASYGQIAAIIGREKNSRLVGRVLSRAEFYGDYPCHRVVNHAGRTAPGWREQRFLLEQEGVGFKENGMVDMKKYQWKV